MVIFGNLAEYCRTIFSCICTDIVRTYLLFSWNEKYESIVALVKAPLWYQQIFRMTQVVIGVV